MKHETTKQRLMELAGIKINEVEVTPANTQTVMSDLKNEKEGVYVLKGGLKNDGRWNEDSLQKGEPVYYTTDTTDPKLKSFQEDGMIWVTIENGEMEVVEY
jgi:hypothetical protein